MAEQRFVEESTWGVEEWIRFLLAEELPEGIDFFRYIPPDLRAKCVLYSTKAFLPICARANTTGAGVSGTNSSSSVVTDSYEDATDNFNDVPSSISSYIDFSFVKLLLISDFVRFLTVGTITNTSFFSPLIFIDTRSSAVRVMRYRLLLLKISKSRDWPTFQSKLRARNAAESGSRVKLSGVNRSVLTSGFPR